MAFFSAVFWPVHLQGLQIPGEVDLVLDISGLFLLGIEVSMGF